MKIAIIAAVYPFRGGAAHYASQLYLNLSKKHRVKVYSYIKQYPQFLYPGKTDQDPSNEAIKIDRSRRILHYANPLSWYKTYQAIKVFSPEILVFNWFTPFTWLQFFTISNLIKKHTKTKILFICHNVLPHESRLLDKFLTRIGLRSADSFIVHSEADLQSLKSLMPQAAIKLIQHPIYDFFNLKKIDKETAQEKIGLKGKIILFFGFIREYKGLKYLIQALPLILKKFDVKLLIVGEFWEKEKKYQELISSLDLGEQIKIISEYAPNEDVGAYFSASDLVILPYISATGSGIVQIANSFNKPAVATKVGSFPDVIKDKETGYLIEPADPCAISEAILQYYSNPENERIFSANIAKKRLEFSWDKISEHLESFEN